MSLLSGRLVILRSQNYSLIVSLFGLTRFESLRSEVVLNRYLYLRFDWRDVFAVTLTLIGVTLFWGVKFVSNLMRLALIRSTLERESD